MIVNVTPYKVIFTVDVQSDKKTSVQTYAEI